MFLVIPGCALGEGAAHSRTLGSRFMPEATSALQHDGALPARDLQMNVNRRDQSIWTLARSRSLALSAVLETLETLACIDAS